MIRAETVSDRIDAAQRDRSATEIAVGLAYERTAPRHRLGGVVAGAVPLVAAGLALPFLTPTTVTHPGLSADLVSTYRGIVVLSRATLWALLAGAFGWLHDWESASAADVTAGPAGDAATRDDRVANS